MNSTWACSLRGEIAGAFNTVIKEIQTMKKALALAAALSVSNLAQAGNCSGPEATSIKDIAAGNPDFSTLVAAVAKADLLDFIDGNRNLTVFAPNNAAFDATAESILGHGNDGLDLVAALDKGTLSGILKYHIAAGERDSVDVLDSRKVRTLSREFIRPSLQYGVPFINNSAIIAPDNFACNGVVHVITGEVLLSTPS
jgi:uncharacterized surface protein with fasciclin (FAS1) repeats